MGASAGTGMQTRRFAEGGNTSSPSGGFGGINPAAIKADPRAFGIGPAALSLQRDLARDQMQSQRQIYRPQYTDYSAGLSSTPQAGYLASRLGMQQPGTFTPQMPTFTRPQAVQQAPSYSIPYKTAPDSSFSGLMGSFGRSSQQAQTGIGQGLQRGNLTEAQYDLIMSNPRMYLPYVEYVQAGNDPAGFQMAPTPNQFMTQEQFNAYNDRKKAELDRLIRPITYFEPDDQGGGD